MLTTSEMPFWASFMFCVSGFSSRLFIIVMECWRTSPDFFWGGNDMSWMVLMSSSVTTFCSCFCCPGSDAARGSPAEGVSTRRLFERSIWMLLSPISLILLISASDSMRKWFFKKGCWCQESGRTAYMPIFNSASVIDCKSEFFISIISSSGSFWPSWRRYPDLSDAAYFTP